MELVIGSSNETKLGATNDSTNPGNNSLQKEFTVTEAIEIIGYGKYQSRLRFVLGWLWTAEACEMLLLSFISPALRCEWSLSGAQEALVTSVVFVGMLVI